MIRLNFLLLPILIFVALFVLLPKNENLENNSQPTPVPTPYVVRQFQTPPGNLTAKSVLVVDLTTDTILFEKNPNLKLPPASLTKLATALVTLQNCNSDQVITADTIKTKGSIMGLVEGEKITVENLLYGLLLPSGNDAALVLAKNCGNSSEDFLYSMNNLANSLGMENTHFTNPTGLETDYNYSTAVDLKKLAQAALENPVIAKIIKTEQRTASDVSGNLVHELENLNSLLGKVNGVLGVKTGRTSNNQENLITAVEREKVRILTVVLAGEDRFLETEKIIDWVFGSFVWKNL